MVWGKAGSTTLSSASATIDVSSLSNNKCLTVLTDKISGGDSVVRYRLNSDTGSNYARRYSENGGSDGTSTSTTFMCSGYEKDGFGIGYIVNISNEEKLLIYNDVDSNTAGAGNAPRRVEEVAKWVNTSEVIDEINIINGGADNFATDSNLSAIGSDITPAAAITFPTNVQEGSRAEITDSRKMYYKFDANAYHSEVWYEAGTVPYAGEGRRGVFCGGSSSNTTMDYITIATTGNATDFGDLTVGRSGLAGANSETRGVIGGGSSSSNVMDYITIDTTGNATDFGDLTTGRAELGGLNSKTRGVFGGGYTGAVQNVMDYITIATTGNATDFGDLTVSRRGFAGLNSDTRGVFGGGSDALGGYFNTMDYITIDTTGNATDFGDLTSTTAGDGGISNTTRGLFTGGYTGSHNTKIDYITIATTGNASDFGDMTEAKTDNTGVQTATRGVIGGGSSNKNIMDYVTIETTGNATDFGDLTVGRHALAGVSDYAP